MRRIKGRGLGLFSTRRTRRSRRMTECRTQHDAFPDSHPPRRGCIPRPLRGGPQLTGLHRIGIFTPCSAAHFPGARDRSLHPRFGARSTPIIRGRVVGQDAPLKVDAFIDLEMMGTPHSGHRSCPARRSYAHLEQSDLTSEFSRRCRRKSTTANTMAMAIIVASTTNVIVKAKISSSPPAASMNI